MVAKPLHQLERRSTTRSPDAPINVFGPPPTSGNRRDAFVGGHGRRLRDFPPAMSLEEDRMEEVCQQDAAPTGPFVEAGRERQAIVQRLQADSNAVGYLRLFVPLRKQDTLKAAEVEGVAPTKRPSVTLLMGCRVRCSSTSRTRIVASIPPACRSSARSTCRRPSFGPGGYLTERGLIPLGVDAASPLARRSPKAFTSIAYAD